MRPRPGDAAVDQPAVHLVIALHAQPRREEAPADDADLVLDLPLLPARGRRAGDRLDQVVAAHLLEAAVIGPLLAGEDRVHRRLHVVVHALRAGALEEGERLVMGVEHHLLALARIGPDEQHAAMAEPHMRHLHRGRHAVHHHDLMAPVELVGFARREAQRREGRGLRRALAPAPVGAVASDRVIAALVAEAAQRLENSDQRQSLAARALRVLGEQPVEIGLKRPDLGPRLHRPLVGRTSSPPCGSPCARPSATASAHGRSP